MRCFLPRWWSGSCLFVAVLACGCQYNRCCCTSCRAAPATVTMGAPAVITLDSAPAATDAVNGGELPSAAPTSAEPSEPAADPMMSFAPPAQPSDTNASTEIRQPSPVSYPKAPAAASLPVDPRFGHDPNYRWLVGTLDYSRIQQAWLLRYVPVEEEDRYGGCVTLTTPNRAFSFKRGQTVRVEGSLIDPDSRQLRPAFQVQNIRAEGP